MLARHTNSRVHVAHVSTAGSVEVIRWAKAQGIDVTAEVTPHPFCCRRTCSRLRPCVQGDPPCAPTRTSPHFATRSPTAPSTRPPTTRRTPPRQGARVRRRGLRCSAGDRALGGQRGDGRFRRHDLDRRRPGDAQSPARIAGLRATAARSRSDRPPTSPSSTLPRSVGRPRNLGLAVAQQPVARSQAHRQGRGHGAPRHADRARREPGVNGLVPPPRTEVPLLSRCPR